MENVDNQTKKLLERPLAKEIMKLLTKNDLSISQIINKMKNFDTQTIIAFLTELQRFGLIEQTSSSMESYDELEKKRSPIKESNENFTDKTTQFPPLKISVMAYNKLWEDASRENGQINLHDLEKYTFTVPSTLKQLFKPDKSNNEE